MNVWRNRHGSLPVILQSEAAECGLACLAMISGFHGSPYSLAELRRSHPASTRGLSLARLIEVSARIGLQARPVKLTLDGIRQLRTPCVLHWDMDHFVVLRSAGPRKLDLHDPRRGECSVSLFEASERFTGVAIEFQPSASFEKRSPAPAVGLGQLTGRVTGLRTALVQVLFLSLCLQSLVTVAPFLLQWILDRVVSQGDSRLLASLCLGFGAVLLLQLMVNALRSWLVAHVSTNLGMQWTGNMFAHLLKLPLDYFEKRNLGDVSTRLGSVQAIQRTLSASFVEAILDGAMTVTTVVVMCLYSPLLASISLAAVVLYSAIRFFSFGPLRAASELQMIAVGKQQTHLFESLRGLQSLKLGCKESSRSAQFANLLVDTGNRDLRLAGLNIGFTTSSQFIFGLERIGVLWVGASLVVAGTFTVGMLIAFVAYRELFSSRVGSLIDKLSDLRMLRLHGERLADIALSEPEPSAGFVSPEAFVDGSVEVRNLSYRYSESEPWILDNCSFHIRTGESVAIVGASGCGKTTLLKVLLGLLRAEKGEVRIGGVNCSRIAPESYRAIVASVMQDDQLFAGSIGENICFGEANASRHDIEAAAQVASIHEEICRMPMQYGTLVGDMGNSLSGGQKQRLVLARALYRRPKVLFLDEATSHLDVGRERLVNEGVRKLAMTRIIVAHRAETIASADRVLVLKSGVLTELTATRVAESA
jgi:ATP-binding cassette subfamily B protein RaxB